MFDPFDDDWLKPEIPVDPVPPQLVQARWLMKLKCRRLRMIRFELREGTWRYFIHGDLKKHREELRQQFQEYQTLLERYEIELEDETKT